MVIKFVDFGLLFACKITSNANFGYTPNQSKRMQKSVKIAFSTLTNSIGDTK